MNKLLLKLALAIMFGCLLYSTPAAAQVSPTTKRPASVRITRGPEIERADPYLTIIRWTSKNPGGSPEHYGVVHYGTNPKELSQTAKSPIRLNPGHTYTVFSLMGDRKSTRLNSSHSQISYAVFCLKKKKRTTSRHPSKIP